MKRSKWPDFLFTLAVRFICGFVLGGAVSLLAYKGILKSFSRNQTLVPFIWLVLCAAAGGIWAIFTVPYWQTPWYKGIAVEKQPKENQNPDTGAPIELPIDGVLDLHTFNPREIKDLVLDYLAACRERDIYQVRLIHGKGIGNLRRTVHSILSKHPDVISFTLDHPQLGGWGATLVKLRPHEDPDSKSLAG